MALAGCTVAEIAAVTGHSLTDVDRILDTHYLGGREDLARQAINKREIAAEQHWRPLAAASNSANI